MRLLSAHVRHVARRQIAAGVTLVELLVALFIVAMLVSVAAPNFGDYINNSRLRESGNLVLIEALSAQSEAVKRNSVVRLSLAGSSVQVIDMSVPTTPVVLRTRTLGGGVTVPTIDIDFGGEGRPRPFPTAVSVDLSGSGMVCSSDLRCPGLRIDAGGAIRLCGNQQSCT